MPNITKPLGSPKIFFYSLFWLIALLFWGTIAQKEMGLYQSQVKFFSSWFLWLGPIPVAGGRLTLTVITINLFFKLFFNSPFSVKRSGIIITHCGSMMLLAGGVLTAYFSSEGSLVVDEGKTVGFYSDYHEHELAFVDTRPKDVDRVTAFHGDQLQIGNIKHQNVPFTISILEYHKNISIVKHEGKINPDAKAVARRFDIKPIPMNPQENMNRAGIKIRIQGLDEARDGIYLLYEYMEVPQQFNLEDGIAYLGLRKRTYPLPFEIELIDFEEQKHPGTMTARSFKSDVNVVRGESKRKTTISMNMPLRTDGYTLYQSSFSRQDDGETSVFAVVENAGRLFPYISSIIICIGILIHLVIQLPVLIRRA